MSNDKDNKNDIFNERFNQIKEEILKEKEKEKNIVNEQKKNNKKDTVKKEDKEMKNFKEKTSKKLNDKLDGSFLKSIKDEKEDKTKKIFVERKNISKGEDIPIFIKPISSESAKEKKLISVFSNINNNDDKMVEDFIGKGTIEKKKEEKIKKDVNKDKNKGFFGKIFNREKKSKKEEIIKESEAKDVEENKKTKKSLFTKIFKKNKDKKKKIKKEVDVKKLKKKIVFKLATILFILIATPLIWYFSDLIDVDGKVAIYDHNVFAEENNIELINENLNKKEIEKVSTEDISEENSNSEENVDNEGTESESVEPSDKETILKEKGTLITKNTDQIVVKLTNTNEIVLRDINSDEVKNIINLKNEGDILSYEVLKTEKGSFVNKILNVESNSTEEENNQEVVEESNQENETSEEEVDNEIEDFFEEQGFEDAEEETTMEDEFDKLNEELEENDEPTIEVVSHTVNVPMRSDIMVGFKWGPSDTTKIVAQPEDVTVELKSPTGTLITPTNVSKFDSVYWFKSGVHSYAIKNAAPGDWKIRAIKPAGEALGKAEYQLIPISGIPKIDKFLVKATDGQLAAIWKVVGVPDDELIVTILARRDGDTYELFSESSIDSDISLTDKAVMDTRRLSKGYYDIAIQVQDIDVNKMPDDTKVLKNKGVFTEYILENIEIE